MTAVTMTTVTLTMTITMTVDNDTAANDNNDYCVVVQKLPFCCRRYNDPYNTHNNNKQWAIF